MKKAREWTASGFDDETRHEVEELIARNDERELVDRFYRELEFGTGGMRGIMAAGTNRMNLYTVGKATQGYADYLKSKTDAGKLSGVALAFDSRNNSKLFAMEAARVLAGNGLRVFIFPDLRPTPLLSFTVRYLGLDGGIVITASHNPKEYNGYKVYGNDGGQVVWPEDEQIVDYVKRVDIIRGVKRIPYEDGIRKGLIKEPGDDVERAYLDNVQNFLSKVKKGIIEELGTPNKKIRVVFTPLHGTGITLVPKALGEIEGVELICEPEQSKPDGNFPTTPSPNPEESVALSKAIELAKKEDADLVIATDPDCDRMGLAARGSKGSFVVLNGNQIGCLLAWVLVHSYSKSGMLPPNPVIITTIVSTELIHAIAVDFGISVIDVLTGFKYFAAKIREFEEKGSHNFIYGFEESYGYLADTFVRDKDGIIGSSLAVLMMIYAVATSGSVIEMLNNIYRKYGVYREYGCSFALEGAEGVERIRLLMKEMRENPPLSIGGNRITRIRDFLLLTEKIVQDNDVRPIRGIPQSNVLQFYTDGIKVSVRPSGTEPKIKFYFAFKMPVSGSIGETSAFLDEKYKQVSSELFTRYGLV
ncbi:MAG: phospho-sugar mutase [Spirochaetota bacterium]